jgi:hypothetical protein
MQRSSDDDTMMQDSGKRRLAFGTTASLLAIFYLAHRLTTREIRMH